MIRIRDNNDYSYNYCPIFALQALLILISNPFHRPTDRSARSMHQIFQLCVIILNIIFSFAILSCLFFSNLSWVLFISSISFISSLNLTIDGSSFTIAICRTFSPKFVAKNYKTIIGEMQMLFFNELN
ncbi:hypothetical protein PUN28_007865 [Cardiocondyla obscurior]|uniref:Uncharacterized protein n=1 Tax=Cardiocondyla obscurior TaxID=286306 RepID=A0AAW2G0S2_9HYME